jgi:hypothetical protein
MMAFAACSSMICANFSEAIIARTFAEAFMITALANWLFFLGLMALILLTAII